MFRVKYWERLDSVPLVADIDATAYSSDSAGTHFFKGGVHIGSLDSLDFWQIEELG